MAKTFARRLAGFAATLGLLTLLVFALTELVPGDAASALLGTSASPEALQSLRAELGLDRSAPERYLAWVGGLATGDLGQSQTWRVPVAPLIAERMAVTLPLTAMAALLALAIALPLAVAAAARPGGVAAGLATLYAQIGLALPNFALGLLLVLFVALGTGWLPAGGFPGWEAGAGPPIKALILPALALAVPQSAVLLRVARAAVAEVLSEDFVRTARAKGASRARALWRHALPNAMVPVVTILGLQFSYLVAGAVLVENVFSLPGMGRLAWQALAARDVAVIQNVVLLLAATVIAVNFLVDSLYPLIDPRLRRRA